MNVIERTHVHWRCRGVVPWGQISSLTWFVFGLPIFTVMLTGSVACKPKQNLQNHVSKLLPGTPKTAVSNTIPKAMFIEERPCTNLPWNVTSFTTNAVKTCWRFEHNGRAFPWMPLEIANLYFDGEGRLIAIKYSSSGPP